jgi:hypothetical protein
MITGRGGGGRDEAAKESKLPNWRPSGAPTASPTPVRHRQDARQGGLWLAAHRSRVLSMAQPVLSMKGRSGAGAAGCSGMGAGGLPGRTHDSDWRLDISPRRAGSPGGRPDSRGWLPGKGVRRQPNVRARAVGCTCTVSIRYLGTGQFSISPE